MGVWEVVADGNWAVSYDDGLYPELYESHRIDPDGGCTDCENQSRPMTESDGGRG